MHPLVRAAAAAAVLSALGSFDRPRPRPEPIIVPPSQTPRGTDGLPALCGPRTIPEGPICLPLPALGTDLDVAEPLEPVSASHPSLEPGRGLQVYDHIPRRPDRSPDPHAYVYPIGGQDEPPRILSGYDLDRPGAAQRRTAHAVGHGGIDIAAERHEQVRVAVLESQEDQAEVVFIGELFGVTVVTSHLVREAVTMGGPRSNDGGSPGQAGLRPHTPGQAGLPPQTPRRMRQYAVLYGHLERAREGLAPGDRLEPGDVIGFAGDSGSPGIVHLHLEIRQLRDGASLTEVDLRGLLDNAVTIPCDPRNVLVPAPPKGQGASL